MKKESIYVIKKEIMGGVHSGFSGRDPEMETSSKHIPIGPKPQSLNLTRNAYPTIFCF